MLLLLFLQNGCKQCKLLKISKESHQFSVSPPQILMSKLIAFSPSLTAASTADSLLQQQPELIARGEGMCNSNLQFSWGWREENPTLGAQQAARAGTNYQRALWDVLRIPSRRLRLTGAAVSSVRRSSGRTHRPCHRLAHCWAVRGRWRSRAGRSANWELAKTFGRRCAPNAWGSRWAGARIEATKVRQATCRPPEPVLRRHRAPSPLISSCGRSRASHVPLQRLAVHGLPSRGGGAVTAKTLFLLLLALLLATLVRLLWILSASEEGAGRQWRRELAALDAWREKEAEAGNGEVSLCSRSAGTHSGGSLQRGLPWSSPVAAHSATRQEAVQDRDPPAGHLLHFLPELRVTWRQLRRRARTSKVWAKMWRN